MKVLQIIDSLDAGGAERMAVNIANELAKHDQDSHICVTRKEGLLREAIDQKVSYVFLNKKGKIGWQAVLKLRNYIKQHHIEVVHAHSTSAFIAVLALFFVTDKPKLIWQDHYGKANELQNRPSKLLRIISRFFDHVISVNLLLQTWAKKELKCNRVTYLENFATMGQEVQLFEDLNGTKGKRIICLANLREQKDHFNLVHAFAMLDDELSDWTLHLCGQDFKDEYARELRALIEGTKLAHRIFILGSRADVPAVLSNCDIAVLSSKSEGLPVALLEYGLYQLPVITTDVGACASVVKDYGILVPAQDTLALSQAMIEMIREEDKRTAYASAFHHHVVKNYGSERYMKQLLKVYNS